MQYRYSVQQDLLAKNFISIKQFSTALLYIFSAIVRRIIIIILRGLFAKVVTRRLPAAVSYDRWCYRLTHRSIWTYRSVIYIVCLSPPVLSAKAVARNQDVVRQ